MRDLTRNVIASCVAILLTTSMYAPPASASGPAAKLSKAMMLINDHGRPLPAEQLIVDAIGQYRKSNDSIGLADAYRVYALFFRSRVLEQANYAARYQEKGFLDRDATYEARYERSMSYLRMAESLLKDSDRADLLSNVYFHMGDVSLLMMDAEAACRYFDQSLAAQATFRAAHPETAVDLPPGTHTFEEALQGKKQYVGCQ
jgi:hypothetical protein